MVSCIVALTAFVPIFGAITGAIVGAALILLVDPVQALWFLIFMIALQQIESHFIYPKIMGEQIGLPSLWVLVAVILGGEFFGIPGIIISVPLCSVIYTLLHDWILKRLSEKHLCKQSAKHVPNNIRPFSDEEYFTPPDENEDDAKTLKQKVKIKQNKQNEANTKKKQKNSKK